MIRDEIKDRLFEEVEKNEKIFNGRVFDIDRLVVKMPDGRSAIRDIIRHPGAAAIIPVDRDGMVTMVYQFRHPLDRVTLEIPAGKREKGEDPLICANRELAEEVGLKADKVELLTVLATSPGVFDERIYIYLATGLTPCDTNPDEDEFLNIERFHIDELIEMIVRGEIQDSKTIVALMLAREHLS